MPRKPGVPRSRQDPTTHMDWTAWDFARLHQAGQSATSGNFRELGLLGLRVLRDWRVQHAIRARDAVIQEGLPVIISRGDTPLFSQWFNRWRRGGVYKRAFEMHSLLGKVLFQAFIDKSGLPDLEVHSIHALSKAWGDADSWQLDVADDGILRNKQIQIKIGERGWFFCESHPQAWETAPVHALGPLVIGKARAWVAWSRQAVHASLNPLLIKGMGLGTPEGELFREDIKQVGELVAMEVPPEVDVDRPPAPPVDAGAAERQVQEADKSIVEVINGQSTVARMVGGSYGALSAMMEHASNTVAPDIDAFLAGLSPFFKIWEDFTGEQVIGVEMLVLSAADRIALLDSAQKAAGLGATIDVNEAARRAGLPMKEGGGTPTDAGSS